MRWSYNSVAPAIVGVALGKIWEENLVTPIIKPDVKPLLFFARPFAMWLAEATLLTMLLPVISWLRRSPALAT